MFQLIIGDLFAQVFVQASDNGSPAKVAYTAVVFTVDRNFNTPVWTTPGSPSYSAGVTVLETIGFDFDIYKVVASDADLTVSEFKLFL